MTDDPLDAMKARWSYIQGFLFPWMREDNDPITEALGRLVTTLDVIGLEAFVPEPPRGPGRPPEDRRALARAFLPRLILGVPTTSALLERLEVDKSLRRILGWERRSQVPSEATFSRAFAEFARGELPDKIHAALIERALGGRIIGPIARAATEIEAREKPVQNKANDGKDDPPAPDNPPPPRKRSTQGPTAAEAGADASRAAGHAEPRPDARRPAHRLRRRLQEKQQGLQRDLDRVQTPHRRGLRPNPGLLRADLGLRPRQPGRHSLDDHDARPRLLSLRYYGRRLRRRRDPRPEPGARPRPRRRPQLSRRPRRQGRRGPRGRAPEAHPHARLRRRNLRFPHHGRARQRPVERRVRRQISPRSRRTQGQMPSHVRHRRARRRSDHPRRQLKDNRPCLIHPGSPPPGARKFASLRRSARGSGKKDS